MSAKRQRVKQPIRFARRITPADKKHWNDAAQKLLDYCDRIFELSGDFDTAVRDSVAQGLAPLVHAAYDCQANVIEFSDTEAWMLFIDTSTAEWFRKKGFVEWFAAAAGSLFNTTPPRELAARAASVVVRRSKSA